VIHRFTYRVLNMCLANKFRDFIEVMDYENGVVGAVHKNDLNLVLNACCTHQHKRSHLNLYTLENLKENLRFLPIHPITLSRKSKGGLALLLLRKKPGNPLNNQPLLPSIKLYQIAPVFCNLRRFLIHRTAH